MWLTRSLICQEMTLEWAHAGLQGDEEGFFETVDKEDADKPGHC